MAADLPPNIWFVRSNGGGGSYPIRSEGWLAVRNFIIGVALSVIVAAGVAWVGPTWLWVVAFAAGMALSAWRLIDTARKHTDYSLTYDDYMKDQRAKV